AMGIMRIPLMGSGEDASRDIGDLAGGTDRGLIADYDPAWATRTVPAGGLEKKASLGAMVIRALLRAESTLDVLYQVLHDEPLFRADMHDGAALAQMLGKHRSDRGDMGTRQSLPQGALHAAPIGDLIQAIDLRGTGE